MQLYLTSNKCNKTKTQTLWHLSLPAAPPGTKEERPTSRWPVNKWWVDKIKSYPSLRSLVSSSKTNNILKKVGKMISSHSTPPLRRSRQILIKTHRSLQTKMDFPNCQTLSVVMRYNLSSLMKSMSWLTTWKLAKRRCLKQQRKVRSPSNLIHKMRRSNLLKLCSPILCFWTPRPPSKAPEISKIHHNLSALPS